MICSKERVRALATATFVAATLTLSAGQAHADVAPGGASTGVRVVPSPPSLVAGQLTSDTQVSVINEQSVRLGVTVVVYGVGTNGWTTAKTVAASTCVQSHLVHYNRATVGSATLIGTVTFNSDVVGVATDATILGLPFAALSVTDPLFRNAGTAYPTGTANRGMETGDRVTSPSARTVNLSLTTGSDMDELRVITLCDPVPPVVPEAPFAVLLPSSAVAATVALLTARRRRPVVD
jgi:hypothetical protein